MKPARRLLPLLFASAGAVLCAPAALGEEVLLRSGTRYDATHVEVLPGTSPADGSVRFSVRLGGGSATLLLPFDRLDPDNLLSLVAARTDLRTGAGHLALARLALARGLLPQATNAFRRAAEVDPSLAAERDAGLRQVKDSLAASTLVEAEADLARGRSDLAVAKAKDVGRGRAADDPIAVRARALSELGSRVLDRDRAQREAQAAAKEKAAADAATRLLQGTLAKVDASAETGVLERERAADPDLDLASAQRALEAAEALFKEARRLLGTLSGAPPDVRPEIEERDRAILDLLVDTYLDLADLHRVRRRFERARDYARAAGVLAPDDARVGEARDRITRDAATPIPEPYDVYEPWYGPGVFSGYGYGYGYGLGVVPRPRAPYVRRPYVPRHPRPVLRGPGNLPPGW